MTLCIVDGLPPKLVKRVLLWVELQLKSRGLYTEGNKPDVILVTLRRFKTTIPEHLYYGVMMAVRTRRLVRVCLIRINPAYLNSTYELRHRLVHEVTHAYGLNELYARDLQDVAKKVMKHGYGQPGYKHNNPSDRGWSTRSATELIPRKECRRDLQEHSEEVMNNGGR